MKKYTAIKLLVCDCCHYYIEIGQNMYLFDNDIICQQCAFETVMLHNFGGQEERNITTT